MKLKIFRRNGNFTCKFEVLLSCRFLWSCAVACVLILDIFSRGLCYVGLLEARVANLPTVCDCRAFSIFYCETAGKNTFRFLASQNMSVHPAIPKHVVKYCSQFDPKKTLPTRARRQLWPLSLIKKFRIIHFLRRYIHSFGITYIQATQFIIHFYY